MFIDVQTYAAGLALTCLTFPSQGREYENWKCCLMLFTTNTFALSLNPPCFQTMLRKSAAFLNFGGRSARCWKKRWYVASRRSRIS